MKWRRPDVSTVLVFMNVFRLLYTSKAALFIARIEGMEDIAFHLIGWPHGSKSCRSTRFGHTGVLAATPRCLSRAGGQCFQVQSVSQLISRTWKPRSHDL